MTKDPLIGKRAHYAVTPNPKDPDNYCRVLVRIVAVKPAFGRIDATVTPIKGDGEMRVSLDSLELVK